MATDSFLVAIISSAAEEIARIDAETEEMITAAVGEVRAKAAEEIERFVAETESDAQLIRERDLNAARVKAQSSEADARFELYDDFFKAIAQELSLMRNDSPNYGDTLKRLIVDVTSNLPGAVISVDRRDEILAKSIAEELGDNFEIKADIITAGGCIATSSDGRLYRENTFESRLMRVRSEYVSNIWRVLSS